MGLLVDPECGVDEFVCVQELCQEPLTGSTVLPGAIDWKQCLATQSRCTQMLHPCTSDQKVR